MPYERSKFGDAGYTAAGNTTNVQSNVTNFYGPRGIETDVTAGVIKTEGGYNELTVHISPAILRAGTIPLSVKPFMPARSKPTHAFLEVEEAFTITGTTPVVSVGTDGSEAANGVDATKAQLEAVGVYDITSTIAGTWAAAGGLPARTVVDVANSAGLGVTGKLGKAKIVIRYIHV